MWCKNCGSEIEPGAKFCTNCGMKVDDNPQGSINESQVTVDQAPVKKSKNSKLIFGVLAGVLILALIGFGLFKFMNPKLSADRAEDLTEDFFERYFNSETRSESFDYLSATADLNSFISADNLKKSEELFDKEDGKIKFDLEEVSDSFEIEDDWATMDFNLKTSVSASEFSDFINVEYLKDGRKWKIDKISGLDDWVENKPSVEKLLEVAENFLNECNNAWELDEIQSMAQSKKADGGAIEGIQTYEIQNIIDSDESFEGKLNIELIAEPAGLKVDADKTNLDVDVKSFAGQKEYEDQLTFVFVKEGDDYKVADIKGYENWLRSKLVNVNSCEALDFFHQAANSYFAGEQVDYDIYLTKDSPLRDFFESEDVESYFEEKEDTVNFLSVDFPNPGIEYNDDGSAEVFQPMNFYTRRGTFSWAMPFIIKLEDGRVKLHDAPEFKNFLNLIPSAKNFKNILETAFTDLYVNYDPAGFDYFTGEVQRYMPSSAKIKEDMEESGEIDGVEVEIGDYSIMRYATQIDVPITLTLIGKDGFRDSSIATVTFQVDADETRWLIADIY